MSKFIYLALLIFNCILVFQILFFTINPWIKLIGLPSLSIQIAFCYLNYRELIDAAGNN